MGNCQFLLCAPDVDAAGCLRRLCKLQIEVMNLKCGTMLEAVAAIVANHRARNHPFPTGVIVPIRAKLLS